MKEIRSNGRFTVELVWRSLKDMSRFFCLIRQISNLNARLISSSLYITISQFGMQRSQNLLADMMQTLDNKNNELDSIYLQKDIMAQISKIPVCHEGFRFIHRLIFCYGLGVLLFIKPYYEKVKGFDYEANVRQIDVIVQDIIQQNGYFGFSELAFFQFKGVASPKRKRGKKLRVFQQTANAKLLNRSNKFRKHVLALKKIAIKVNKAKIGQSSINDMSFFSTCFNELRNHELNIYDSMNYFELQYHRYLLISIIKSLKKQTDSLPIQNYLRTHIERVTEILLESAKSGSPLKPLNSVERRTSSNTKRQGSEMTSNCIRNDWLQKDRLERLAKKNMDETQLRVIINDKKELESKSQKAMMLFSVGRAPEIRRMCCRTYFIQGEMIEFSENLQRQYKDYRFPLTSQHLQILKKTIVGFLNAMGGIIYLGIKEQQNRIRRVFGVRLDEQQKQCFLFSFRSIVEAIQPQIIVNKLYKVQFVPVKSSKNLATMPGRYVIKIIIEMGKPRELYTYLNSEGYNAAFRTENEVIGRDIKRDFKKVYEIIKDRLLEPPRVCVKEHEGKCLEPELGLPCYSKN